MKNIVPLASLVILFLYGVPMAAYADGPYTYKVERVPVPDSYSAEATIEAVHDATLAAQVTGRVTRVNVDAGDEVTQGQVLLHIDATRAGQAVRGADAGVAQAQAELSNAKAAYNRAFSLKKQGFMSPSALEQAQSRFDAAQAQLRAAQASQGQAATTLSYTTMTAPFDAVVAERHVDVGELIQAGSAALTLFKPAKMRALVDVPQYRWVDWRPSQIRARVAFSPNAAPVDAAAITMLPAADAATHTVRVRVDLPDNTAVMPGSFARVYFFTGNASRLAVMAMSVVHRSEIVGVYVKNDAGDFHLRQIRTGLPLPGERVEVLAGLQEGEEVAVDPSQATLWVRSHQRKETK